MDPRTVASAHAAYTPGESQATTSRGNIARQALLQAGREVFGMKNLEGATVRDIAEAAGTNVAAISYHFGSKEALYEETVKGVIAEMQERVASARSEILQFRAADGQDPDEAVRLVQLLLRSMFTSVVSAQETLALSRILVREQMQPTAAFEHIYQGMAPMHQALTYLVAVATGIPAESEEATLRAHSLIGQVIVFRAGRSLILRRLGRREGEPENLEPVGDYIAQHAELILCGLRAQRQPGDAQQA